ncbi:glycosyltransferase family 4 protein [Polymorphum gilvum]|uniref:Glycosyl transferase group 1 n=1 Tax=Polymorphum gilvum (strain LMG 25793 / CGMCC 1.9160 / SL003B-26A1) TaxID=991905 RepID=F2J3D8_POLGS|nr:glycosyltransferase family 1 protein [Polymorphum gilvum]ADZ70963.1 Glycosyl transferase group 1 [Polymorphum gilvum SL003B-26A1]
MTLAVILDITRLMSRGLRASPTGIDRVELAYLDHLLERADIDLRFVKATRFGVRLLDRRVGEAVLARTVASWGLQARASSAGYRRALAFVHADTEGWDGAQASEPRVEADVSVLRAAASYVGEAMSALVSSAAVSPAAVYINVAHSNLGAPALRHWLERTGVRSVFLVHDLIPITHPEYCRPGHADLHRQRMETVALHGAVVIANSAMTRDVFLEFCRRSGLPQPRTVVGLLGIEPVFRSPEALPLFRASDPYFVVLGTIEPRKNHLLLLQIWRDMVERDSAGTPRLIVIGRRGWENENILDFLERCAALKDHVMEASGLTDVEIAALMRNARGVLVPSFVEGFSLPVVEAEAVGVPVLASDIPVHREVGGPHTQFLSPLDGLGWQEAIEQLAACKPELGPGGEVLADKAWPGHFEVLDRLLAEFGRRARPPSV